MKEPQRAKDIQDDGRIRITQLAGSRPSIRDTTENRNHQVRSGSLQHQLGKQNLPRILNAPPREIVPTVRPIPTQ